MAIGSGLWIGGHQVDCILTALRHLCPLPSASRRSSSRAAGPSQKEADYGLAKGERLRERAAQSTAGLHASARILREVLGWPDLQPCGGWQHGGHTPAWGAVSTAGVA